MQRFVDPTILVTIDLGDNDWVKVPRAVSFDTAAEFEGAETLTNVEKTAKFLATIIKEWNLTIDDGTLAPINEVMVRQLDIRTLKTIMEVVKPLFVVEKKDSTASVEPSTASAETQTTPTL